MSKLCKLTDGNGRTWNGCQWGEGIEHTAPGNGGLCSSAWIHAYTDPLLAVLFNPVNGNLFEPQVWEAEGDVGIHGRLMLVGCTRLKTIRRIPWPAGAQRNLLRFGLLCGREACGEAWAEQDWSKAIDDWLDDKDRIVPGGSHAAYRAISIATEAIIKAARQGKELDVLAIARQAMNSD